MKVKKQGWINICKDKDGNYLIDDTLHPTEIQAIRCGRVYGPMYVASAQIEWEEEV